MRETEPSPSTRVVGQGLLPTSPNFCLRQRSWKESQLGTAWGEGTAHPEGPSPGLGAVTLALQ